MKQIKTTLGTIGIFVIFFGIYLIGVNNRERSAFSSVQLGGEYTSTTTAGMGTGVKQIVLATPATIGSVVIASTTSLGSIEIRDATSTTDVSSTTITSFPLSTVAGTYTFDVNLKRGLGVVMSSGFNGGYVITYRER